MKKMHLNAMGVAVCASLSLMAQTHAADPFGNYSAGGKATATENFSTAVGYSATASGLQSTAVGSYSSALGKNANALGVKSKASAEGTVALGSSSFASEVNATAVGVLANATGQHATAIGYNTTASAGTATAIGNQAFASIEGATAVGNKSQATHYDTVAFGDKAESTARESTALGVTAQASKDRSIAVGYGAKSSGTDSTAIGTMSEASASNASALGRGAQATGLSTTAIGQAAVASGSSSTALGSSAKSTMERATAIGVVSKASGAASIALGFQANATANNAMALGSQSSAGQDSITIGTHSQNEGTNNIVVGQYVDMAPSVRNTVVLGSGGSETQKRTVSAQNAVLLGNNSTGVDNAVSVGSETNLRKIVNVNDGEISENSHEAVTGGQIHTLKQSIDAKADIDAKNIDKDEWAKVLSEGAEVKEGNKKLVTGAMVYEAIQALPQQRELSQVANVDGSNIDRHAWREKLGINRLEKSAHAGIASAMAMSAIPEVKGYDSTFGVGVGQYKGQAAIAVGLRTQLGKRTALTVTVGADSQKSIGTSAGLGFGF